MKHTRKNVPPPVKKFPAAKQRRLDLLLEKNSERLISPEEKATLEKLVAEAEQLMVANAKRLAAFANSARVRVPDNAVPVTVWVVPSSAKP